MAKAITNVSPAALANATAPTAPSPLHPKWWKNGMALKRKSSTNISMIWVAVRSVNSASSLVRPTHSSSPTILSRLCSLATSSPSSSTISPRSPNPNLPKRKRPNSSPKSRLRLNPPRRPLPLKMLLLPPRLRLSTRTTPKSKPLSLNVPATPLRRPKCAKLSKKLPA